LHTLPLEKLQKHSSFSINQLCHLHGAVTVQMPRSKKKHSNQSAKYCKVKAKRYRLNPTILLLIGHNHGHNAAMTMNRALIKTRQSILSEKNND